VGSLPCKLAVLDADILHGAVFYARVCNVCPKSGQPRRENTAWVAEVTNRTPRGLELLYVLVHRPELLYVLVHGLEPNVHTGMHSGLHSGLNSRVQSGLHSRVQS